METPNPENISVATSLFYLDPSHNHPIPSELLSFCAEFAGFDRVKTLRLQEPRDVLQKAQPTLLDVLSGVSPDYSIVAQKAGNSSAHEALTPAFEKSYGVTLDLLAARYDAGIGVGYSQLEKQLSRAEEWIARLESQRQRAESVAWQTQQDRLLSQQHIVHLESKIREVSIALSIKEQQVQDIFASTSWKLTAPLRWLVGQVIAFKQRRSHKPVILSRPANVDEGATQQQERIRQLHAELKKRPGASD
jgi:O-antigen chain-terminating methyltransferase